MAAKEDDWEDRALFVAVVTVPGDGRFSKLVGDAGDSDTRGDLDKAHEGEEEESEELHDEPDVCRSVEVVDEVV